MDRNEEKTTNATVIQTLSIFVFLASPELNKLNNSVPSSETVDCKVSYHAGTCAVDDDEVISALKVCCLSWYVCL